MDGTLLRRAGGRLCCPLNWVFRPCTCRSVKKMVFGDALNVTTPEARMEDGIPTQESLEVIG